MGGRSKGCVGGRLSGWVSGRLDGCVRGVGLLGGYMCARAGLVYVVPSRTLPSSPYLVAPEVILDEALAPLDGVADAIQSHWLPP